MKKSPGRSFLSFCSFVALLATSTVHGQNIAYLPGNFDVEIAFGCNCTCFCNSNSMNTNSPVSMFLSANPVSYISGSAAVPPSGQVIPPQVGELFSDCTPPDYSFFPMFQPEGWTATTANFSGKGSTAWVPVSGFNLNFPTEFDSLPYDFYANTLIPDPLSNPAGQNPLPDPTDCQPFPWDVNLTLLLHDNQYYYMDQQLVIGLQPVWYMMPINPVVNYMETNSLVTFSLYCTDGGVTNLLTSDITYTITAILLTNNIPLTNDQTIGWSGAPADVYTNWEWPFTFLGATDLTGNIRGAAGSTKAQLSVSGVASVDNQPLLVEADRAYQFNFSYYLYGTYLGTLTNITDVIPPCTNVNIAFYTVNCTNVPIPFTNTLCYSTNTGDVDMLGAPNIWPVLPADSRMSGITIWAQGDGNIFWQNLAGLTVPETFNFPVLIVNDPNIITFTKWATENLGTNSAYEYFSTPTFLVNEQCSAVMDLSNILVMRPTNPAIVRGTISLSGCVDTNYYGGTGALSFLLFPDFNHPGNPGFPYDPITGIADPTLTNESCLLASSGASAPGGSVPTSGGGRAAVEFDNPGGFSAPNSFNGNYSMALAGLESEESFWNANDLHLVFGSPVNLAYDIYDTDTNLDINCGTTYTNDISYCFGLVTLQVTNTFPPPIPLFEIYTQAVLEVSGSGPGYTVGTFTVTNTFNPATPYIDTCDVPLFLPQGNYQYVATVYTHGGGILNLGVTNYFTINCCNTNPCLLINCPTNIVVTSCTNVPVYYFPTATDSCCSNGPVACYPSSGTFFAPGTTNTVVCWASDTCGNTNYCDFTVTVLQGTNCAPCLQVQATNLTVLSCSNVFVSYPLPVVTDPCCGTNWNVQYYPPSGSLFHSDMSSNVVCIVSDGCGNTNYSTFSVTVTCTNNTIIHIGPIPNNGIIAYWYQLNPNYILQYNTNLATTNWVDVTNAIPLNGVAVTNTSLPAQFYRIYNPHP